MLVVDFQVEKSDSSTGTIYIESYTQVKVKNWRKQDEEYIIH